MSECCPRMKEVSWPEELKKCARKIRGSGSLAKNRLKVSDSAALAQDLCAETSKLDLGAVVDTCKDQMGRWEHQC